MKGLFEMSLLLGMILSPILLAQRSHAYLFRSIVLLGGVYYVLALFIIPRLPG